jgi:hypothetical protein
MNDRWQRGQVLPLVAICLTVLCGFAALAVDAGYLQYRQRLQQTAADSAALAGAWQLIRTQTQNPIVAAAKAASASNGFTDGSNNVTVTINWPPATGPNKGYDSAIEAIVTAQYPAIFSAVMGWTQSTVATRAVAVVRGNPGAACIYILQKNLNIANGTVTGPCGALVNNDVQANNKTVWNIPYIGAGGHIISPPANAVVSTGIGAVADPCQTVPGCIALTTMFPLNSNVKNEGPYSSCAAPTSTTLGQACYTSVSGTYNVTPGLIVIAGDLTGSLICQLCDATHGVTVVVGGKVNLNGSTTNLTAPPATQGATTATVTQSGGAPGVVLYQVSTSTAPENFSAQQLFGMVYAPDAHVNQNAGSTLVVNFLVVADFVTNGNTITVNNTGGGGPPTQVPILAE